MTTNIFLALALGVLVLVLAIVAVVVIWQYVERNRRSTAQAHQPPEHHEGERVSGSVTGDGSAGTTMGTKAGGPPDITPRDANVAPDPGERPDR